MHTYKHKLLDTAQCMQLEIPCPQGQVQEGGCARECPREHVWLACWCALQGSAELLSRAHADSISSKGMQSGGWYRFAQGAHHGAEQGTKLMPRDVSQALTGRPLSVKAASELVLLGVAL